MEIKLITAESEIRECACILKEAFAGPPYNEKWGEETAFNRLAETYGYGKEFCFYAEENGMIVGFIFCRTQVWDDGAHLIIEDAAVEKDHRNKGIGTKLAEKLEQAAKNKGITAIDGFTHKDGKAIKFWERQGYQQDGYVNLSKKLQNI